MDSVYEASQWSCILHSSRIYKCEWGADGIKVWCSFYLQRYCLLIPYLDMRRKDQSSLSKTGMPSRADQIMSWRCGPTTYTVWILRDHYLILNSLCVQLK